MNREIKFRAWDEKKKVMHYEVEFIRSGIEGNDWIIFKSDKQKLEDGEVWNNPYFTQQIKLMQFTGLTDKNGKEIYEGDILGYWGNATWSVTYGKTKAGFVYGSGNWESLLSKSSIKSKGVIGNIYESPELLN